MASLFHENDNPWSVRRIIAITWTITVIGLFIGSFAANVSQTNAANGIIPGHQPPGGTIQLTALVWGFYFLKDVKGKEVLDNILGRGVAKS